MNSSRQGPDSTERLVICATAFDGGNPYAEVLYREAERLGYEVWRRPLVDLIRSGTPPDRRLVVHLHWISHVVRPVPWWRAVWAALRYLVLVSAVRVRGLRVVWTFHNELAHEGRHQRLELVVQWWLARIIASRIIVMTDGARSLLAKRFSERVASKARLVPHPTYETAYGPAIPRRAAREILGLEHQETLLLVFGRVLPYKGVLEMLEAFREVDASHARVLVVGECTDPALQADLETAASRDRRVSLHFGRVPDEEVPLWFSAADWVVLPYRTVLNSGVFLLSATYRRPVIATAAGALPELVGKGGLLYEPRDPAALARALLEAVSMPDAQRRQMRAAVDELALQWAPSAVAHRLVQVYEEAAS